MDHQFKEISLLESLLNLQKNELIFAIYLQNVATSPSKMANNARAHLEFCKSRVKHSDKHVHRIVNCIKQLRIN